MTPKNKMTGDPDPPDGSTGTASAIEKGDVQAYGQDNLGDPDPPDGANQTVGDPDPPDGV